jgi:hypothetical protein
MTLIACQESKSGGPGSSLSHAESFAVDRILGEARRKKPEILPEIFVLYTWVEDVPTVGTTAN